jgi:hypothetical protein
MKRFFSIFGRQATATTAFVLGVVIGTTVLFAFGCANQASDLIINETISVYDDGELAYPIDGSDSCYLKKGGKITIVAFDENEVLLKYFYPHPTDNESRFDCLSGAFVTKHQYQVEEMKKYDIQELEKSRRLEFFRQEAEKFKKANPQSPNEDLPAESPNQP